MLGGKLPADDQKSYRVGRDGPLPSFVIEVTSEETRQDDLKVKPLHYAAVGVKEYLIIDILNKRSNSWQLIGYRLEDSPYYQRLKPDADGGRTFTTVGLRFVAVNCERVDVYDITTGKRLLTGDELMAQAEAAAIHAEAETQARLAAEARAVQAEARVAAIEQQLRQLQSQSKPIGFH